VYSYLFYLFNHSYSSHASQTDAVVYPSMSWRPMPCLQTTRSKLMNMVHYTFFYK